MKRASTTIGLVVLAAVLFGFATPAFAAKTYTMKDGDTLWDLSAKFFGDPTLYPVFLEVNRIDNVRTIPTGKVIVVPSVDELKKISSEHDPAKRKALISNVSGSPDPSDSGTSLIGSRGSNTGNSGSFGSADTPGNTGTPIGRIRRDSFMNVINGKVQTQDVKKVEIQKD
jgi:hypothetical protein